MKVLLDTNILVYAANRHCAENTTAKAVIEKLVADRVPWCLTWGIAYEFFRVSTHPNVFRHPLAPAEAVGMLNSLLDTGTLTMLVPSDRHGEMLRKTIEEIPHLAGNIFHDVTTAVLMREHGVSEIYSGDADFRKFPFLKVTDPVHGR